MQTKSGWVYLGIRLLQFCMIDFDFICIIATINPLLNKLMALHHYELYNHILLFFHISLSIAHIETYLNFVHLNGV
jgi:hypothetical protein